MALKTIVKGNQSTNYVRMGELQEGETVAGYLLGTEQGTKFPGFLIKLLTKDGKVLTLTSNGNLNKLEDQVEAGDVILNVYTEFSKVGSYKSKTQMDPKTKDFRIVSVFDIAQDTDDVIAEDQAAGALAEDASAQEAAASAAASAGSKPAAGGPAAPTSGSKFANRARR